MYPQAYISLELHDAHEFAWLIAPIRYTAAQDLHSSLRKSAPHLVACRPPRGLTPQHEIIHPKPPLNEKRKQEKGSQRGRQTERLEAFSFPYFLIEGRF